MAIDYGNGAKQTLKSLNRLFRCTRSPFNTSAHGKMLQSARRQLLQALRNGGCDDLLDMWFPGICRDQQTNASDFSINQLIELLKKKSGKRVLKVFCFPVPKQGFFK